MPAIIVPFPAARLVGKARRAAQELAKRSGERRQGQGYWQNMMRQMSGRMAASGIADDMIERELSAFSSAVGLEMARLQGRHSGGTA